MPDFSALGYCFELKRRPCWFGLSPDSFWQNSSIMKNPNKLCQILPPKSICKRSVRAQLERMNFSLLSCHWVAVLWERDTPSLPLYHLTAHNRLERVPEAETMWLVVPESSLKPGMWRYTGCVYDELNREVESLELPGFKCSTEGTVLAVSSLKRPAIHCSHLLWP